MTRPGAIAVAALLIAAAGCKREPAANERAGDPAAKQAPAPRAPDDAAPAAPAARWYRALVTGDGVEIPFLFELPAKSGTATFLTGDRRQTAPATWTGDQVEIRFDAYHTAIAATRSADGALRGKLTSSTRFLGEASLDLTATPIESPAATELFDAPAAGNRAAALGVWKLEFQDDSGVARLAIDPHGVNGVTGILQFDTGNQVLLAGGVRGNRLRLAAFDGSSPYSLDGELAGDAIRGNWIAGPQLAWRESFRGTRSSEQSTPSAIRARTAAKISLEQLSQPPYKDNPVVIELAGSWCPACEHAAPILVDLHRRHHEAGLQVLTLDYEFTDDRTYNVTQAEAFKQRNRLPWEVVPVHGDLDSYAEIMLPELEDSNPAGFPIFVFVRRDRTIAAVHAGFPPPEAEAGRPHRDMVAKLERLTQEILGPRQP